MFHFVSASGCGALRLQHGLVFLRGPHLSHGGQGRPVPAEDVLRQGQHILPGHGVVGGDDLLRGHDLSGEEQGPAGVAHPGLGGFQAHDYVGLGLLPGPGELFVGGTLRQEFPDDLADGPESLFLGVPVQGGVDAEDAGVRVAGPVGVDE